MANPVQLEFGKFYHVYNRGNNRENIFIQERNYHYFLQLWRKYVNPIAETYAYCLLRNHFHFLIGIREFNQIPEKLRTSLSQPFSNLFNAYARTINQTYHRTGALFQRPFGRIEVKNDAYFLQVIAYIHRNPQKHGFVADYKDWPYSSYQPILSAKPAWLNQGMILGMFGSRAQYIEFNQQDWENEDLEV
jgi:putative transposase